MTSSTEQTLINGLTYVENLIRVPKAIEPFYFNWPTVTSYITGTGSSDLGLTSAQADAFFTQYNNASKPLPSTYSAFTSALSSYAASLGKTFSSTTFDDAVLAEYLRWTNSDANTVPIFSTSGSTDWSIITPTPNKANLTSQMKNFISQFLQNYPYVTGGGAGTMSDFFAKLANEASITALLQTNSTLQLDTQSNVDLPIIPRYDKIYSALFPNAPAGAFAAKLNQFYQEQIATRGFFSPSIALSDWANELIVDFGKSLSANPYAPTSLAGADFHKTLILDRIFTLISSLVGTLQNIAAVQANRLVILSNWQQAYTNNLSQLHTFLQTDGTFIANKSTGNNDARAYVRGQANDKVNASLRELLQSNRSIVGDTAKALQSNVNQTNDAVSQQAQAATAILQELTSLLGAIYR